MIVSRRSNVCGGKIYEGQIFFILMGGKWACPLCYEVIVE